MIRGKTDINHDRGAFDAARATVATPFTVEACDVGTRITLGNNRAYAIQARDVGKVVNRLAITDYDHGRAHTVTFWKFENLGDDIRARHMSK